MPGRVPRTEYSAHDYNWELVKAVTGCDVSQKSPQEVRNAATLEFIKKWNYDYIFYTSIHYQVFNDYYTKIGHASYSEGAEDFDDNNRLSL